MHAKAFGTQRVEEGKPICPVRASCGWIGIPVRDAHETLARFARHEYDILLGARWSPKNDFEKVTLVPAF